MIPDDRTLEHAARVAGALGPSDTVIGGTEYADGSIVPVVLYHDQYDMAIYETACMLRKVAKAKRIRVGRPAVQTIPTPPMDPSPQRRLTEW
jgi:hypothetical protein